MPPPKAAAASPAPGCQMAPSAGEWRVLTAFSCFYATSACTRCLHTQPRPLYPMRVCPRLLRVRRTLCFCVVFFAALRRGGVLWLFCVLFGAFWFVAVSRRRPWGRSFGVGACGGPLACCSVAAGCRPLWWSLLGGSFGGGGRVLCGWRAVAFGRSGCRGSLGGRLCRLRGSVLFLRLWGCGGEWVRSFSIKSMPAGNRPACKKYNPAIWGQRKVFPICAEKSKSSSGFADLRILTDYTILSPYLYFLGTVDRMAPASPPSDRPKFCERARAKNQSH